MPPKLTTMARPVARYRKGQGNQAQPSDSDDEDDQQQQSTHNNAEYEPISDAEEEEEDVKPSRAAQSRAAAGAGGGQMRVSLREVEVDAGGQVRVGGRLESGRTKEESPEGEYETDEEDQTAGGAGAPPGAQESSSEYETDSEEEEAPKVLYKPVFVSKRNRDTLTERAKELDPEALELKRAEEAESRKKMAHDLVAASITRELAQKDVTDEKLAIVDDTDGLDPSAEFEEWKLRELMRIKRDKEATYAREKEREEVSLRRALPEALRLKEDTERAKASRQNKQKGNQVFGQKYHHKGAFYADDAILTKHDYSAPTVSTVRNMETLPSAMQKRDFGKASQSKYTHLAAEDTSRAGGGGGWDRRPGASGGAGQGAQGACFNCGGPHLKRDCPQAGGAAGPSGTNGGALGPRDSARVPPQPSTRDQIRDEGWGSARRPPPTFRAAETSEGGAPPRGGEVVDYGRSDSRRDERYGSSSRRRDDDDYRRRDLENDRRRGDEERYGSSSRREDRDRERERPREEPDWRNRGSLGGERERERYGDSYGSSGGRRRSRSPGRERDGPRDGARDRPPHDDKRRRVD